MQVFWPFTAKWTRRYAIHVFDLANCPGSLSFMPKNHRLTMQGDTDESEDAAPPPSSVTSSPKKRVRMKRVVEMVCTNLLSRRWAAHLL